MCSKCKRCFFGIKLGNEENNAIYKWQCPCFKSSYIGMTGRPLLARIQEHHRPQADKPIFMHFSTCSEYQKKFRESQRYQGQKVPRTKAGKPIPLEKRKFNFFKNQFTIWKKNFRSYYERRTADAYFIRTQRPDLNGQHEHKFFTLFWLGPPYFCD